MLSAIQYNKDNLTIHNDSKQTIKQWLKSLMTSSNDFMEYLSSEKS